MKYLIFLKDQLHFNGNLVYILLSSKNKLNCSLWVKIGTLSINLKLIAPKARHERLKSGSLLVLTELRD